MTHSQEETHTHTQAHSYSHSHSLKGKPNKDSYTNMHREGEREGRKKKRKGNELICVNPEKSRKKQTKGKVARQKDKGARTESWDRRVHAPKWREAEEPEGASAGTYPLPRAPFTWVGVAETHTHRHTQFVHTLA